MAWSSWGPGHPAANGLGPDTARTSVTLYGAVGPAPAADGAPSSSRTLTSSARTAAKAILDLIAHPSLVTAGPRPQLVSLAARRTSRGSTPACISRRGPAGTLYRRGRPPPALSWLSPPLIRPGGSTGSIAARPPAPAPGPAVSTTLDAT